MLTYRHSFLDDHHPRRSHLRSPRRCPCALQVRSLQLSKRTRSPNIRAHIHVHPYHVHRAQHTTHRVHALSLQQSSPHRLRHTASQRSRFRALRRLRLLRLKLRLRLRLRVMEQARKFRAPQRKMDPSPQTQDVRTQSQTWSQVVVDTFMGLAMSQWS